MRNRITIIIKTIGLSTVLTGLYPLIHNPKGTYLTILALVGLEFPPSLALLSALFLLLHFLKIAAGTGLFFLKPWSRRLAITVLTVDLILKFIEIINLLTFSIRNTQPTKFPTEGSVVGVASIWPSYIIGIITFISIILLFYKPIVRVFDKNDRANPTTESA